MIKRGEKSGGLAKKQGNKRKHRGEFMLPVSSRAARSSIAEKIHGVLGWGDCSCSNKLGEYYTKHMFQLLAVKLPICWLTNFGVLCPWVVGADRRHNRATSPLHSKLLCTLDARAVYLMAGCRPFNRRPDWSKRP